MDRPWIQFASTAGDHIITSLKRSYLYLKWFHIEKERIVNQRVVFLYFIQVVVEVKMIPSVKLNRKVS